MKNITTGIISLIFLAALFFPQFSGFAISVDPDFEGTLVITSPQGEIDLIEKGDSLPSIESGAMLEVFDGEFTVTAEGDENVDLSCLEHDVAVSGGGSVALGCGESSGMVRVLSGTVILETPSGEQIELSAGETYSITIGMEEEAEPTAQLEGPGTTFTGDLPPVDTTGLDTGETGAQVSDTTAQPGTPSS